MLRPNHISSGTGGTHVQCTKPVIDEGGGEKSKKRRVVLRDQEDLTAADPDLVFTASKFVKNILEKAKIEAAKRLKAKNLVSRVLDFHQKWIKITFNKITRFVNLPQLYVSLT